MSEFIGRNTSGGFDRSTAIGSIGPTMADLSPLPRTREVEGEPLLTVVLKIMNPSYVLPRKKEKDRLPDTLFLGNEEDKG